MRTATAILASLLLGGMIGAGLQLTSTPDAPAPAVRPSPTCAWETYEDGWSACVRDGQVVGSSPPGPFAPGATLDPTQVEYQNP